jgi:Tfp pilus assembly protein FimT
MAIAVPSILAIMTRTQLSNSVELVRDTLEISRTQATQKNKICNIYIPTGNQIVSNCLISADSNSSGIPGVPNTTGLPSVKLDDQIEIKQVPISSSPLLHLILLTILEELLEILLAS